MVKSNSLLIICFAYKIVKQILKLAVERLFVQEGGTTTKHNRLFAADCSLCADC